MKYIDAEKLLAEIERRRLSNRYIDTEGYENELLEIITSLQQEQPEVDLEKAAEEYAQDETMSGLAERAFKAGAEWQREQYECIPTEESYMRGFAQGAKEEREGLSPTMLTYAADIFAGKMLVEDISYSYRQELADYFRDLAKMAKATNARKEE